MQPFSVSVAVERMAVIIVFLLIGAAAGRARQDESTPSGVLDKVVLDWLLPITILYNISDVTWRLHAVYVVGLCCVITVVDAILVVIACRLFHIDGIMKRTLLLVVPLGNTAYFGFAAVTALLGSKFLPDAIIFDQIGTTLMLAIYGNAVARASGGRASREELIGLLRFRPLWGFGVGVILDASDVHLMSGSTRVLGTAVSSALLPVAMLALGSKLATKGLVVSCPVIIGVTIRVLVGPAIVVGVVAATTASKAGVAGGLMQTAMPSMIAAALLAERRGLASREAYSLCAVGVVAACVVLPALAWFLLR